MHKLPSQRTTIILLAWLCSLAGAAAPGLPTYRIENSEFEATNADIRAVCDSACGMLWQYFPGYTLEPFVVTRGHHGPIVLHRRNDRGEIVMQLDTGKTYWSQYAYQFSHEFCHILCGFDDDQSPHEWFEETLCELASLYTMRAMARSWQKNPPYPNWQAYHDSLREYVDDTMLKRVKQQTELHALGMAGFYRKHEAYLLKTKTDRDLNGVMAAALLPIFESEPTHWESVRWLNSTPSHPTDTFATYLQKWRDAAPQQHRQFISKIADLYGVPLP